MAKAKKNKVMFLGLGMLVVAAAVLLFGIGFAEDDYFMLKSLEHLGDAFDLSFGYGLQILLNLCVFITAILTAVVGLLYTLKVLKKETLAKVSMLVLFLLLLVVTIVPYCTVLVKATVITPAVKLSGSLGMWAYWVSTVIALLGTGYAFVYKKLF